MKTYIKDLPKVEIGDCFKLRRDCPTYVNSIKVIFKIIDKLDFKNGNAKLLIRRYSSNNKPFEQTIYTSDLGHSWESVDKNILVIGVLKGDFKQC